MIRNCTYSLLLALSFNIFIIKFSSPSGTVLKPRSAETEVEMLESELVLGIKDSSTNESRPSDDVTTSDITSK